MAPTVEASPTFYAAAKRQFGRGFSWVAVYTRFPEYCAGLFAHQSEPEKSASQKECVAELAKGAVLGIKNARYLFFFIWSP
jgi:hypothetical protein